MLGPVVNLALLTMTAFLIHDEGNDSVARLADEVRGRGWVVFCAKTESRDWDLFLSRPDGSDLRAFTHTPEFNEAAPQFSRDGRKLLYRRLPRRETIDGNHYGAQGELVVAASDGSNPVALGESGDYAWASWSPDGEQIACLSIKGISLVDVNSRRVIRAMPRKGFFQQMTWSPDGQSLAGVANAFGAGWSVAKIDLATGEASAVSRVDCCTPDWFPDSRSLIFSNRPPGQLENSGNGWTQLWRADVRSNSRGLVYGEDGRHIYGGHVSPDGKYVVFTGNMREDGDPGHSGAPMGLLRLADAPIIGGASKELRKLHPEAKSGPVLVLPAGWEPCWTVHEIVGPAPEKKAIQLPKDQDVGALTEEVRNRGWIAYSATTDQGNWDLFLMRPDGSRRRAITRSSEYNEAGVKFSPSGEKMLYYRIPTTDPLDNNTYGTYELVLADADGGNAVIYGRGFSWASWGPDGTQLACLDQRGITIVDVGTRKIVRQMPRRGVVEQLVWSPDGKSFAGTANGLGPFWNIGRIEAATGHLSPVSETERYNCTPDWMPGSRHILYSRGIIPDTGGFAELWIAGDDGKNRRLLYGEENRHIYGGCSSPDGNYLLFTRSEVDLGRVDNSRTGMAIIRMADTPMFVGHTAAPRANDPSIRRGPVLDLSWGWEPHWTYAEVPPQATPKP